MSELVAVTIISGIFSVIVALIGFFASIRSAEISKTPTSRYLDKNNPSGVIQQRFFVVLMVIGVLGAMYFGLKFASLVFAPPTAPTLNFRTIDTGNITRVDSFENFNNEPMLIYIHHPANTITYDKVNISNGKLYKVTQGCGGSTKDITDLFTTDELMKEILSRPEFAHMQEFTSSEISISNDCSIYFFISNTFVSEYVSFSFDATYKK